MRQVALPIFRNRTTHRSVTASASASTQQTENSARHKMPNDTMMKNPCPKEKAAGIVGCPLKGPQSKKLMLLAGADKEPGMRGEDSQGLTVWGAPACTSRAQRRAEGWEETESTARPRPSTALGVSPRNEQRRSRPNPERQFRLRHRIRETQGQFLRQQNSSEREA